MDLINIIMILLGVIQILVIGFVGLLWFNFKAMILKIEKLDNEVQDVRLNVSKTLNEVLIAIKELEIKFLGNCEAKHQKLEDNILSQMKKQ
jgi:hypothetical protein